MAGSASADTRPLAEEMAVLRTGRASGRLQVSSGEVHREILFVNGDVRAVHSNADDERLGAWLVNAGVLSDDDVAFGLLSQLGATASPLGHLLVERGLVAEETLARELEQLAITIVERAAARGRTTARFLPGGTARQPDTLLSLSTQRLILAAARVGGDEAVMTRRLGSLERPGRLCGPLETIMYDGGFTVAELSVLQRVEGAPALADLQWMMSTDPAQLVPSLYALVVAGYVVVGERAVPRSQSPQKLRKPAPAPQPGAKSADDGLPEGAVAIFRRCAELVRAGNVPEALQRMERLCAEDPRPEHLIRMARFMREQSTGTRRILVTLQQALERDPRQVDGWVELARFWRLHASPERERKALIRALHLDPDHEEAKRLLAELQV